MRARVVVLCLVAAAAAKDVALSDAQEQLAAFRTGFKHKKLKTSNLIALLDKAVAPFGHVVADEPPPKKDGSARKDFELRVLEQHFTKGHDKWERGLRDALLDAMVLKKLEGKKNERVNVRLALNLRAAEALRAMPTGTSDRIIRRFERHYMKIKGYTASTEIFNAVFGTLAKRDEPGSFRWLLDEVVTNDRRPEARQLTASALWAMVRFPYVRGRTRNRAVKLLIKTYAFTERQVKDDATKARNEQAGKTPSTELAARRARKEYWDTVGPYVIAALNHLATDPITNAPPKSKQGRSLTRVAAFDDWFDRHKAVGRSPWRDPPE